uniref:Uncharacterized protein n=1 Tax=Mycena chlorophos TaxID=658473 RepID=A0ABQ0L7F7_MYCCL|nr:predicted protein [Mycena chlorophos]
MYIPLTTPTTQTELYAPNPFCLLVVGILLSSLIYGAFLVGRWTRPRNQLAGDSETSSYASTGSSAFPVEKSGQHNDESGIIPAAQLASPAVIQPQHGNVAELPAAFSDSHSSGCPCYHPPSPSLPSFEGDPNPLPSEKEEDWDDDENGDSESELVPNALAAFPDARYHGQSSRLAVSARLMNYLQWWTWGQPWAPKTRKNPSASQFHAVGRDSSVAQTPSVEAGLSVVGPDNSQNFSVCDLSARNNGTASQ